MRFESVQLFIDEAATDATAFEAGVNAALAALPGLRRHHLGRNLEGCWGAGSHTLDLEWDDGAPVADSAALLASVPGFGRADAVTYQRLGGGVRDPQLQGGIWRTLLLRVRPEVDAAQVADLEHDLLRMPAYMRGIRNWNLGRVTSDSRWTHVWQQEYAEVGDLLGEYLVHPFHWGFVDRWFDPEFPEWTVEVQLCHAFCPLRDTLLGRR